MSGQCLQKFADKFLLICFFHSFELRNMNEKTVYLTGVMGSELALNLKIFVVHVVADVLASILAQLHRVALLHQVADCRQI